MVVVVCYFSEINTALLKVEEKESVLVSASFIFYLFF
jgi:hypothetical protein